MGGFLLIKIKYLFNYEFIEKKMLQTLHNTNNYMIADYTAIYFYVLSWNLSMFFYLKNNPLLFAEKVSPDKIYIFLSSFWLQFATFVLVDFASSAQTEAENFYVSSKFLSRMTHLREICVRNTWI